ncbi:disease resistance protein RPV1-like [Tripterygium wilfordii]|uniref:disease resistance protein RPV1-like n=1 Tax=Tripterygium wilfordii TaxID=458696 RepID=UPI0018F8086E|nr:disease resistance protein RPV1-like [Tripterygium wilfordii]
MAAFSSKPWIHDVFLSFRDIDTGKNFTDHLRFALKEAGINSFRNDDEDCGRDDLVLAIQNSRISIIVFSKNYAASRWCLEQLVKIMECRKTTRQLVLPIFYDVDPSDVRKQNGLYAEAFDKHEQRFVPEKVMEWRAALTDAANLSGWDLRNTADGHEAKFIKIIVGEILREVNSTYLHVATYPVGIDPRAQDINLLLNVGSDDVRMVGICGMGGIGKTTIAKAVYNQLFHSFEGKSFLANVRETAKQPNWQIRLQENLLSDILKAGKMKINSVDMVKEILSQRKVLVILDDVDQLDQLNAVARNRDWFGPGSRVIITSRDDQLLKKMKMDEVYMAKELDDAESIELFSWHAFRKSDPVQDYVELSRSVVNHSGGLPLALEVLGSFLYGRTIPEWRSALERLRRIPHSQIRDKLRISYDGLSNDKEKDMFLDIACFFIGMDKYYVVQILDGCGFFAESGISLLIQRCLVKINGDNKLVMHDLLRDMGRDIVRESSPKDPGRRTRLWLQEDVIDVLVKHRGTEFIEGLILKFPGPTAVKLDTKAFSIMQRLRLLQLTNMQFSGDSENFSKELRWLCWRGFPWKFIPNNFYLENLVAMDMRYSNLRRVWNDCKFLGKLKFLNLSHSQFLTHTPDFSKLPNLERLILKGCKSLVEIHQAIGQLDKLVLVNLKDCKQLKNLPGSFSKLKSLETLILSGCSRFDKLPEDLGDLESLISLIADNTVIAQVPLSIVRLKNLQQLSLCGCKVSPINSLSSLLRSWVSSRKNPIPTNLLPASLHGLISLRVLSLKDCNLSNDALPKDIGTLPSLEDLNLESNSFQNLPGSLSGLAKLRTLTLDRCDRLESIPDLPVGLKSLYARYCTSLERTQDLSKFLNIETLTLSNCHNLIEAPGLDKLKSVRFIRLEGCKNISNTYKESILQGWAVEGFGGIYLPGNEIPDWYSYKDEGPSVFFQIPKFIDNEFKGFSVCVVFSSHLDKMVSSDFHSLTIFNYTKGVTKRKPVAFDLETSPEDHLWQSHFSSQSFDLDCEDEIEIFIDFGDKFTIKKTGVYLIYEKDVIIEYKSNLITDNEDEVNDDAGVTAKRGRDEDGNEAGPSHGWSDEEQAPKRLRYEPNVGNEKH